MLYPPAEAHSKPSQASNMEFLARTVKNFKLSLLAFFCKTFHRRRSKAL